DLDRRAEELEAPRLVGDPTARRRRRHVGKDDVIRREEREVLGRERERVAARDVRVRPEDDADRREVDRQELPALADLLLRIHRPRPGRGPEMEAGVAPLEEANARVDLLELEDAPRRIAARFGGLRERVRFFVGVFGAQGTPPGAWKKTTSSSRRSSS